MISQQEPLDNCWCLWAGNKYLFFFPMLAVYLASSQEENLEKYVLIDYTRSSTSELSGVAFRKCHPRRDLAVHVVCEYQIKLNTRMLLWRFSHVLKHIHQEHGHLYLSWGKESSHAIFKTQQLFFWRHHLEHERWQAKEILFGCSKFWLNLLLSKKVCFSMCEVFTLS